MVETHIHTGQSAGPAEAICVSPPETTDTQTQKEYEPGGSIVHASVFTPPEINPHVWLCVGV